MMQGRSTKVISMIEWIRTSRLSTKNSLSSGLVAQIRELWRAGASQRRVRRCRGCQPAHRSNPVPVLGAFCPFLEPFCGHLSPKVDEIFQKLLLIEVRRALRGLTQVRPRQVQEREFCIDNLLVVNKRELVFIDNPLVRIHLIIEMTLVDRPRATGV